MLMQPCWARRTFPQATRNLLFSNENPKPRRAGFTMDTDDIRPRLVRGQAIRQIWAHPAMRARRLKDIRFHDPADETPGVALEGVQNGGLAVEAYAEAIAAGTSAERREQLRRQLLAYCQLDTLAMVRIWSFFIGKDIAYITES
jgi:hypothetical protein